MRRILLCLALGAAPATTATAQRTAEDAVLAILSILDSVPLVAISDAHMVAQMGAFYQHLLRHPRFPDKADDVILELGNELYQSLADRYVAGDAVPPDSLRMIWEDNTQGPLLTSSAPMYADVLHAVRAINAGRTPGRRVRVLLGDPAVEWRTVTRDELWRIHMRRGDRMRELARDSVVGKGRRGIIIAGGHHLRRRVNPAIPAAAGGTTNKWGGLADRVFVIGVHMGFGGGTARFEPRMDSLPAGTLLRVRSTFLAGLLMDEVNAATPRPGAQAVPWVPPVPPEGMVAEYGPLTMADVIDGVLYLGPISRFTYSLYDVDRLRRDPARVEELSRRARMMLGRGVDTTRLFQLPDSLVFPEGWRADQAGYAPITPPPASPPPLPARRREAS